MDFDQLIAAVLKETEIEQFQGRLEVFKKQEAILNTLPPELKETATEFVTILYNTFSAFFNQGVQHGYEEARNRVMGVFGPDMPQEPKRRQPTEEELKNLEIPEDAVGEEIPLTEEDEIKKDTTPEEPEKEDIPAEESVVENKESVSDDEAKDETNDDSDVTKEQNDDGVTTADASTETLEVWGTGEEEVQEEEPEVEYKEVSSVDMSKIMNTSSKKDVTDIPSQNKEEVNVNKAEELFNQAKIKQREMVENNEFVYQEEKEEKVHGEPLENPTFWNAFLQQD